MTEGTRCGGCGELLPVGKTGAALAGLCPKCLAGGLAQKDTRPGTRNEVTRIDVERPPLKAGSVFRGLEIQEVLGRGGMGFVYRARQQSLDRLVALKVLSPELVSSQEFVQRFEHEAKLLASLNHPHIVHVYEYGREGDVLFLTMEHVDGTTLQSIFDRPDPADLPTFLERLIQVAKGLHAIHEAGLVHRDVKPANLLIARDGRARIADFGIAVETENAKRLTETGTFVGTPHYVSPEHVMGKKVDGRSDLYSLGVILYEGIAGKPPFDGPSTTAVLMKHVQEPPPPLHRAAPNAPPALQELVRRLLAKNPASRPDSAAAVVRDLERALESLRTTRPTLVPKPVLKVEKPVERKLPMTWIAGGAAAAVVLIAALFLLLGRSTPEPEPVRPVAKRPVPKAPAPPSEPAPAPEPAPVPPPPPETPAPPPAPVKPPQEGPSRVEKTMKEADDLFEEAKKEKEAAKTLDEFTGVAFKVESAKSKYQAVVEVAEGELQKKAQEKLQLANQLGKSINDARKAAAAAPAPAPTAPAPTTPVEPGAPAAKVIRLKVPDAAKQAEAEKLVRDIFKDAYAKKAPADVQKLAKDLLEQGRQTKDDAVAQFVLLREARDAATQAGDIPTTLQAVDELARLFEIDGGTSRLAALEKLAVFAKGPDSPKLLAKAYIDVAEELARRDEVDTAWASATKAETIAKAGREAFLSTQATILRKRLDVVKVEYPKVKARIQNPAMEGQDLVGAFYCFVKAEWERGLPILAASAAGPVKSLATLDLSKPADAARQVEVGDGWWDLSEKEPDAWKKARIQERAKLWYGSAMPSLSGMTRLKVEKRLGLPAAVPEAGLVGYWKLDEKSGPEAFDASGQGNHGKYVNDPEPSVDGAPLKFSNGGSRKFVQGRSQHVEVADSASLKITGSLTLAAWVKPVTEAPELAHGGIEKFNDNGRAGFTLRVSAIGVVWFIVYSETGGKGISTTQRLTWGTWSHIVGVYDQDQRSIRIYLDGKMLGTEGSVPPPAASDQALFLGADYGSNQFNGQIDDVRIYNRALSEEEVRSLAAGSERAVGGKAVGKASEPVKPGVPNQDRPAVDPETAKAIAYLKSQGGLKANQHVGRNMYEAELVLWTFVTAGVPLSDPDVQTLFKSMMERKLETVYDVSLQAAILEEIDRVKYQWRLQKCAQYLVDNQATNGRWSYGMPSLAAEQLPQGDMTLTAARPLGVKAKVTRRLPVRRTTEGATEGDNSNSAYAAMGLRACFDAGILMPAETLSLGEKAWRQSHKSGVDAGWCYSVHPDHKPYGSMTACGVASLSIYDYMKGGTRSWKSDRDVNDGLTWLAKNYSVKYHPGPYEHAQMAVNSMHQFNYYLYSLERAATLYGTDTIGTNKWHAEGVKNLQTLQSPDGSWGGSVVDTCLAVLFMSKGTRPLDPLAGK